MKASEFPKTRKALEAAMLLAEKYQALQATNEIQRGRILILESLARDLASAIEHETECSKCQKFGCVECADCPTRAVMARVNF